MLEKKLQETGMDGLMRDMEMPLSLVLYDTFQGIQQICADQNIKIALRAVLFQPAILPLDIECSNPNPSGQSQAEAWSGG